MSSSKDKGSKKNKKAIGSNFWFWSPRFWSGMNASAWASLLKRNGFQINLPCVGLATSVSIFSGINSAFGLGQRLIYGKQIEQSTLEQDPIFIIGHWRSGTTLLHELLVLDDRYTYPDTYAAFAPDHFLISAWLFKPMLWLLLPSRRPMDNMLTGWRLPQEDEFAMCNLGARSPYLTMAFPNRPPQDQEYLDMDGVPAEALQQWKNLLLYFIKAVSLRSHKPVVLKSPPHTARLRVLLELFPRAKFVHIVRDPYAVFSSTVNLWKRLYKTQGLQVPKFEGLEEQVFSTFERMYAAFERDRGLVPAGQLCEVRYEDLVASPIEQMATIYEQVGLGEFEAVRPKLEAYFAQKADYKTNRYELEPEMAAEVARRWSGYIERYGYSKDVECAK
jgi:hypothetical protein